MQYIFMISKLLFFFASPIFNCRCRCVYIYLELITQGIFYGSCMWKLLKYISLFCWCSQSRRTMTRHLNQPSYDFSLCPKDRKNNTTQHDTINWMGIKSEKGILINFLKLFYGIDAQHDNWWWRFFLCECVRHIPPNRSTFSYPKVDGNFYFGIII